ncbi:transposase [Sinorhizobium medicae]|nr:transposase [Sinorhizobium medicae]
MSAYSNRRDVDYGYKLNLTTGRSGLILDLAIEAGNPADSERLLPLLERHIAFYGEAPRQAAADGGYASRENLRQGRTRHGLPQDTRHGLPQEERPQDRRHGQEPLGVSKAQKLPGGHRSRHLLPEPDPGPLTWRELEYSKSYVWSSVVACNLALFARLRPT